MPIGVQNKLEKWMRKWLLVFKNKCLDNITPDKMYFCMCIFSKSLVLPSIKRLNRKFNYRGVVE